MNAGSRFHVSTISSGIELENLQPGWVKADNSIVSEKESQPDMIRKGIIATTHSQGQERNRKMSRDVIPSIEHYRSHPQVQTTVRRPTMHELCNQISEEVSLHEFDEVTRNYFNMCVGLY